MVLQTVLVVTLFSSLVPCTRLLTHSCLDRPRRATGYLTNVSQPIRVRGYTASDANKGPWLQAAVRAIDLSVILPANPGTLIRSLQLGALALRFDANGIPFCSTTVIAHLNIPFKCPLDIRRVESLSFVLRAYGQDMLTVRPFSATDLDINFDPTSQMLTMTTISAQLTVLRMELFQDFAASVLVSPGTPLDVVGFAAPTISTAMGNVTLPNIPTDGSVFVQVCRKQSFLGVFAFFSVLSRCLF
jgi:hypothetical protein